MFKIESQFISHNFKCVVIFTEMGHRCGYVGISQSNPLYGIGYSEEIKNKKLLDELKHSKIGKRGILPIVFWDGENVTPGIFFDVHGGITYSEKNDDYPVKNNNNLWWYGFDCAHCNDGKDWDSCQKYFPNNDKWKRLKEIDEMYPLSDVTIKTKDYVEQECKNLARQIKEFSELITMQDLD